jgi:protein TonB
LALVVATVALGLGAVGARQWILTGFFVMQHEVPSVLDISNVELREEEKPREAHLPRVARARPFAPSTVMPVPIPSLRPELVRAPPLPAKVEPYDPSEDLEAAADPFPTRPEAKPEPVVAERRPKEISKPERHRPITRQKVTPKLVAKGPSYPAKVLRRYQPAYPRSARRAGVEGRVTLSVQVRADGRVGLVRVSLSSGSAALDSAAISAIKRWSFSPEQKNGKAVTTLLNVPFRFALN